MMRAPNERARLYFLLAWFHAIVQERLRYAPLGWSKSYEFNESDLKVACDMLDTWIDSTSMGRTNLPPERVPWKAILTLLSQCIYGGKIDNEFDQRLLVSFLEELFNMKCFEADHPLVQGKNIHMPEGVRRDQFLAWIDALPDKQSPDWLGLPNNAETVLLTNLGKGTIVKLLKMQQLDEDEELAYDQDQANSAPEDKIQDKIGQPAWMRSLNESVTSWLTNLPKALNPMKRTVENIKDPLYRYFEREVNMGCQILSRVRCDLQDIWAICRGDKKQTNDHRSLISQLTRGIVPRSWTRYKIPANTTVNQWINDFCQRVRQLEDISRNVSSGGATALRSCTVWLGGLFNPEAYITATRQCVAQANSWSLEELFLDIHIGNPDDTISMDDFSFGIEKLKLQGGTCHNNQLKISNDIMTDLHVARLRWLNKNHKAAEKIQDKTKTIKLPVYLNATRTDVLFTANFAMAPDQQEQVYYERGVALIASTTLN